MTSKKSRYNRLRVNRTVVKMDTKRQRVDIPGRIIIYCKEDCQNCAQAKKLLRGKTLPFAEVNVNKFPNEINVVKERTGKTTFPQIFFNHFHIGDHTALQQVMQNASQWSKLVDEVKFNSPTSEAPCLPDPSTAAGDAMEVETQPVKSDPNKPVTYKCKSHSGITSSL